MGYSGWQGYRLLGTKHVHCTPGGWSTTRPPVCAKPGCPPLLPAGSFPYGRARPLLSGAALKVALVHNQSALTNC